MIEIKRAFRPARGFERIDELPGYLFTPEMDAHTFIITKVEKVDGQETAVPFDTGTEISARLIKADGVTELVDGSLADGAAVVTLPAECYQVPGRFTLTVYASLGGTVTCIYAATSTVLAGDTEDLNIAGGTVRNIDAKIGEIRDAISDAQDAVDDIGEAVAGVPDVIASIPQDYTALSNSVGDLKSTFTNNGIKIVGQIASTVTTISSLTEPGLYFIPKAYVGNLTDKPSDMSTANNYALLVLYSAGQKVQQLIADWVNFDTIWDRHKTTTTWSNWNKSKFNGLGPDEQFADRGNIDSSTTSLVSVLKPGAYFISSTVFSGINDLPSNIANNNSCVLVCYHIDTRVAQWLWQKDSGYLWMRYVTISNTSATAWAEIHDSKYLVKVDGADANNITWNGFYGWGSTETVYNVPNNVAAGMLCNIMRTATTKYQFGIDYFTNNVYSRNCQLGTWSNWRKLAYSDEIQTAAKPKVKYQSGSYAQGLATEKLDVFIPTQSGYILYRVYHFINTDVSENYNVWRIYQANRVDDLAETGLTYITTAGEWECALHLNGRGDFSGGSTHGDEVMTDVVLIVDGLPVAISSLTSMTDFGELRLIRTSHLYDPNDHTTVIADHGVEYVFSGEGLTINQSVNWKVAEQLERCYLAMFLPSKARIDRMAVNTDFEILELPSDETTRSEPIVKQKGTAVTMWDTGSGVYAEVSIPTYPAGLTGGDTVRIQDNSTSSTVGRYNKLYYTVCDGGSSTIGELWKSTTVYKIGYNGAT